MIEDETHNFLMLYLLQTFANTINLRPVVWHKICHKIYNLVTSWNGKLYIERPEHQILAQISHETLPR